MKILQSNNVNKLLKLFEKMKVISNLTIFAQKK